MGSGIAGVAEWGGKRGARVSIRGASIYTKPERLTSYRQGIWGPQEASRNWQAADGLSWLLSTPITLNYYKKNFIIVSIKSLFIIWSFLDIFWQINNRWRISSNFKRHDIQKKVNWFWKSSEVNKMYIYFSKIEPRYDVYFIHEKLTIRCWWEANESKVQKVKICCMKSMQDS